MKRPAIIAVVLLGLGVLAIHLTGLPILETVTTLAFGWFSFLARVIPRQHVNANGMLTAATCVMLLLVGLHSFLRWFTRAWNVGQPDARHWRFRWTAIALGLTLLMFVAGTAFVGMVHQSIWLATSPEPHTYMAPDVPSYGDTSDTMKQIGLGLMSYEGTFRVIPPGDDPQHSGGVQHSWQTLILPYIVYSYRGYHFDQPWNAAANKDFCSRPVEDYLIRGVPGDFRNADGYAVSHYAGSSPFFLAARDKRLRLKDVRAETLVMGEAAGNFRPWADPANLRNPADLCRSPSSFGNTSGSGAYFLQADGRVRYFSSNTDPQVLQGLSKP